MQDLLSISINLLLALYLVYPRYLFNMGPRYLYMYSRGVETLRIDEHLTLILLTNRNLTAFHRLSKYWETLSVGKAHPSLDTYCYKFAAVQKLSAGGVFFDAEPIPDRRGEEPED